MLAVVIAAGLQGIRRGYELAAPAEEDVSFLSDAERRAMGYAKLPTSLESALAVMEGSELVASGAGRARLRLLPAQQAHRVGGLPPAGHPLRAEPVPVAVARVQRPGCGCDRCRLDAGTVVASDDPGCDTPSRCDSWRQRNRCRAPTGPARRASPRSRISVRAATVRSAHLAATAVCHRRRLTRTHLPPVGFEPVQHMLELELLPGVPDRATNPAGNVRLLAGVADLDGATAAPVHPAGAVHQAGIDQFAAQQHVVRIQRRSAPG